MALVALLLWGPFPKGWLVGGIPPPVVITNRVSGLDSLRDVLWSERFAEISRALECLPLWRLSSRELEGPPGYLHFFEFATARRHSSRVYRLEVSTERDPVRETYAAGPLRHEYGSAPMELPAPAISSPHQLDALRLALADPEVHERLAMSPDRWSRGLHELRIGMTSQTGVEPTHPAFDFILGFHWGGPEGAPGVESEYYRARYDPVAGTAEFSPWTSGGDPGGAAER